MSEFAFSAVGINPHHGTPVNAATLAIDATPRAPGGSTSGGATTVASGAAWAALGSDTGGSIRIPAALQGVVGFKGTARLVPIDGAVPLSTTLDTVSAITRSVRDAIVLHEILADRRVTTSGAAAARAALRGREKCRPRQPRRHGRRGVLRAASPNSRQPARRSTRSSSLPLDRIAALNAAGGFPAAESWAFHRRWLAEREAEYDPRVARRIKRGEAMSAADYVDLVAARRAWIASMESALQGCDAVLSPTVPMVAPALAPLVDDDEAFFLTNGLLLRNPSIVNFLDGCALSLPCHGEGELPVGLMVWSTACRDDAVLDAGLAIEAALAGRDGHQRA